MRSRIRIVLILPAVVSWLLGTTATSHALEPPSLGTYGGQGSAPGQLLGPNGCGVADDGAVYVADTYNGRVNKYSSQGVFLLSFGSPGSGPGQFLFPYGIDVDGAGQVYVGDFQRGDVQVFSSSGIFLRRLSHEAMVQPLGLWVANDGTCYVAVRAGGVHKFAPSGSRIAIFSTGYSGGDNGPQHVEGTPSGTLIVSNGIGRVVEMDTSGVVLRSFAPRHGSPTGAAVVGNLLFLTYYTRNSVEVVSLLTEGLAATIGYGESYGLSIPFDVAVHDGVLHVLEAGAGRVRRLDISSLTRPLAIVQPAAGASLAIGSIAPIAWVDLELVKAGTALMEISRDGGGVFSPIAGPVPNDTGTSVWRVTGPPSEECRLRVTVSLPGGLTRSAVSPGHFAIRDLPTDSLVMLDAFGGTGSGPGQLSGPNGIATSDDGRVYVADTYNGRIQWFTLDGVFMGEFVTEGRPYGIDVDAHGNVYVSNLDGAWKLRKYSASGVLLHQFSDPAIGMALGLHVSDDGTLYVADPYARVIRLYDASSCVPLGVWGPTLGPGVSLIYPQNIEADGCGRYFISDGGATRSLRVVDGAGLQAASIALGHVTGGAIAGGRLILSLYRTSLVTVLDAGTLLAQQNLGTLADPFQFQSPLDIASYGDSLAFVLDTGNSRVVRIHVPEGARPDVEIIAPNGGEVLIMDTSTAIEWEIGSVSEVSTVDALLSRDRGRTWRLLASAVPNTGSLPWSVMGPATDSALVRVVARTTGFGVGKATSARVFAIISPATSTLLASLSSVDDGSGGLTIRWLIEDIALRSRSVLERASRSTGPFLAVRGEPVTEGAAVWVTDREVEPETDYWYRVVADGRVLGIISARLADVVSDPQFRPVHPYPSQGATHLRFALPRATRATMEIIDVMGRLVVRLLDQEFAAGHHAFTWTGEDRLGPVAPGLYFARLQVQGEAPLHRRILLQR